MKTATAILAQLKLNPEINPRSGSGTDGLEGLMAQIRDKGCIGQIWVRPAKGKKHFEVIDGSRRFRALEQLAKAGDWKKDGKIPVNIFDASDAEARDLALAANFEREPLSPADEAIGFTRLTLSGMKAPDIAAHYAVTERLVLQRVAIGTLPNPILSALRDGKIDIGTAQLFTSCPAERALKIFKDLDKKKSLKKWNVEEALEDGSVSGNDRRCLFVGAPAYEAAGGVITRDLFSNNEMWNDEKLLDTLFEEAIAAKAQALKDEGWSFVDILRKNTYVINSWGKSVANEVRELRINEKIELKELKSKQVALISEARKLEIKEDNDELSDSERERLEELELLGADLTEKIKEFEAPVYTPRQMSKAGAIIAIEEHGGTVRVLRGLIKPTQKSRIQSDDDDETDSGETPPVAESVNADYSDAIIADLQGVAQKATKLAMVLHKPALTARMGLAARILAATELAHGAPFKVHHQDQNCGDAFARIRDEGLEKLDGSQSFASIVAALETFTPEEIMLIEAYLAADTFAVLSLKNPDVQAVITMIDPNMAGEGWQPGKEFLERLNRAQLLAIIREIDPTDKTPAATKKGDLVDMALPLIGASNWMPPQLRTPSYNGPGSSDWLENLASSLADQTIAQLRASPGDTPELKAAE